MLNTALSQVSPLVSQKLIKICNLFGFEKGSAEYTNVGLIIGIILYSALFLLPALFIFNYVPKTESQIGFQFKFTKKPLTVIIGAVGIVAIANYLTNLLKIIAESIGIGFYQPDITVPDNVTGIILFAIYTAIIPAIVEELLFRKVILNSLLPYGKAFAVISSAVLFSLMHCNPSQTLYTFTAGIILAAIALKTKSLVFPMTVHFLNNLLSVGYMLLYNFASETVYTVIAFTVDGALKIFGAIFLYRLFKSGYLSYRETDNQEKRFSVILSSARIMLAAYILYSAFVSIRWVYII